MKTTDKDRLIYLNALAEHIQSLGYEVEEPDINNTDILDIWGKIKGRKCFIEITITIFKLDDGIVGYVIDPDGDNDEECYLDTTYGYGLDTRFLPLCMLGDLEPMRKGA